MNYTITPIMLGRFVAHEKSVFTYKKDYGVGLNCPLFVFLVQGGGKTVLFDCGPVSPELAPAKNHRQITDHISLTQALASKGLTPDDIDCVVLSHLHWDHSYNLELFPHCPIYVQAKEVAYSLNPLPCDYTNCNIRRGNGIPQWLNGYESFVMLDGDYLLADGLKILTLGGHSPALHGLLVDTEEGRYLLSSDHYPLLENFTEGLPSGNHTDLRLWYESHEKAKQTADFVLPGHDDCVLERDVYGKLENGRK